MKQYQQLISSTLAILALSGTNLAYAQDLKGDAVAGKTKTAMCIGCHGIPTYKASFPNVYSVPMIAGQNAKYIENALIAYKKGERKHPSMKAISASLSAQDMADLAAYYSSAK